ncbi:MAG: glutaminyl-peptide cyclotransferase, partial [Solimonas sp.]
IDPATGRVGGWLDLAPLRQQLPPAARPPTDGVLNGIAYDAARDRLYVTGKRWPRLFALKLHWPEKSPPPPAEPLVKPGSAPVR